MEKVINTLLNDNNYIILSNIDVKERLISELSKSLKKITYKTFSEFVSDILGEVSDEVLIKNLNKNEILDITKLKLENARLVTKLTGNKLTDKLFRLNEKYFKSNKTELAKNRLYNARKLYVINYNHDDDLVNLALSTLQSEIIYLNSENEQKTSLDIKIFNTAENEIFYTVNEISKLLSNGVKADDIIINTPSSDYEIYFKEAFNLYEIDYSAFQVPSLLNYEYTKNFILELFSNDDDFSVSLEKVVSSRANSQGQDLDILNAIIGSLSFIQKYEKSLSKNQIIELVKSLLSEKKYEGAKYSNIIKFENVFDNIYDSTKHIFIVNFNQDIIPHTYKNDTYIKDEERIKLGLLTSNEKNKLEKQKIESFILSNKNVYLSYALSTINGSLVKSSLIDEMKKNVHIVETKEEFKIDKVKNKKYAMIKYLKAYQEYEKYSEISENLQLGYNTFNSLMPKLFDNQFDGCNQKLLSEHLEKTNFSYTSIGTYYLCPFRYYLSYVLNVKKPIKNIKIFIGSWFHKVLENLLKEESDENVSQRIKQYSDEYISKSNEVIDAKLAFYIDKLNERIEYAYNIIKEFEKNSEFKVYALEKKFEITLKEHKFVGTIDKILKYENYYVVVDYKTNEGKVDWLNIDKGLELQLPIYAFLIKNMDKKAKIAGCYLQSILDREPFKYENKTLEEMLYKNRRYNGYTLQDRDIINAFDKNSDSKDACVLSSKPYKSGGVFSSAFEKVSFVEDDFNRIIKLTKKLIEKAIVNIEKGKFNIAPVSIEGDKVGCKYCEYKDLCFKKHSDYQEKNKNKDFSFLTMGGKENGN